MAYNIKSYWGKTKFSVYMDSKVWFYDYHECYKIIYRIFYISYMRANLKYDNSIIVKKCIVSMQQHGAICL